MAYDRSTDFEGSRRHHVPGLTLNVQHTSNAVQIEWQNDAASKYPILRGFKKTGSLTNIEDLNHLFFDTYEENGKFIDHVEKGITYYYFFRTYLSYVPGSFNDPEFTKLVDKSEKQREEMWQKEERIDHGPLWWWEGFDSRYEEPPSPSNRQKKENPVVDMLAGLFMMYANTQRGNENAKPLVKFINSLTNEENVALERNLKATAAPHYITFQFAILDKPNVDEVEKTKHKIDGAINKEKLKWERIESLEKEYMTKQNDIINSSLPETEKLNKMKVLQESYAELMDKVRNM